MNQENAQFLVVDDEPELCWILENILKKNGLACRTAGSAQEAIALMESQPFQLAFLDAKLPDMDGLKLAQRLRKFAPRLPIIIVSGCFYQDEATVEDALKSGLIAAFISKPFSHDEIVRVINLHAGGR